MLLTARYKDVDVKYRQSQNFAVVNPDFQQHWLSDHNYQYKVSRPTRNKVPYHTDSGRSLPAVCRFTDDRFVLADCDFQKWLFDMNYERSKLSLVEAKLSWRNLFRGNRFITNYTGSDTRRDCINGTNLNADWIQLQPMITGGVVLKYVAENTKVLFVEAINPYVNYKIYNPITHKWLFFTPTVSARYWVEEEKKLATYKTDNHPDKVTKKQEQYNEPFHQFNENSILPVMGMIPDSRSSTGFVNSVEKYRVRKLNEPVPNPFVMRFGRTKQNPYEGVI